MHPAERVLDSRARRVIKSMEREQSIIKKWIQLDDSDDDVMITGAVHSPVVGVCKGARIQCLRWVHTAILKKKSKRSDGCCSIVSVVVGQYMQGVYPRPRPEFDREII